MEAGSAQGGSAQGGCPQNRGQSLGSLLLPPGWADRAPHLPWPGGGPDPGPGPSQADTPPVALTAANLSQCSQGQVSRRLGARPQGDSGQTARNGRSSLLPLGRAILL